MQRKGNEKYKDNIFRYLFSEEKNFVQLYYDLTGKLLKEEDLEFYDTESIVVKQLKNDVAFKTKDNRLIIMVEHQSTLNENMPLRFLLYYVELLKLYITQNELNIFSRRALNIPTPEFFVVYNGVEELEKTTLYLKANLDGADEYINIRVNIININYDKLPKEVKERNDILDGYSFLMNRIRLYNKQQKLLLEKAIEKAIEETKVKGYLKEYLERKEFIVMITKVLTIEEEIDLIRRDERKEGRKEVAVNLLDILDDETIAIKTGLSIKEVKQLRLKH